MQKKDVQSEKNKKSGVKMLFVHNNAYCVSMTGKIALLKCIMRYWSLKHDFCNYKMFARDFYVRLQGTYIIICMIFNVEIRRNITWISKKTHLFKNQILN